MGYYKNLAIDLENNKPLDKLMNQYLYKIKNDNGSELTGFKTREEAAQVQRELNLKGCRDYNLKPVELSSIDEVVKQEAFGSLAQR